MGKRRASQSATRYCRAHLQPRARRASCKAVQAQAAPGLPVEGLLCYRSLLLPTQCSAWPGSAWRLQCKRGYILALHLSTVYPTHAGADSPLEVKALGRIASGCIKVPAAAHCLNEQLPAMAMSPGGNLHSTRSSSCLICNTTQGPKRGHNAVDRNASLWLASHKTICSGTDSFVRGKPLMLLLGFVSAGLEGGGNAAQHRQQRWQACCAMCWPWLWRPG